MKQLVRLLIVAIIAGAVATIIVQRDRLRQLDREQVVAQVREGIQSLVKRGEEAALAAAEGEQVGEPAEATAEVADEAAAS